MNSCHLTYNRPTSGMNLFLSLKNNQPFSIEVYKIEREKKSVINTQEKQLVIRTSDQK